jgi:hypothetical protein
MRAREAGFMDHIVTGTQTSPSLRTAFISSMSATVRRAVSLPVRVAGFSASFVYYRWVSNQ